MFFCISLRLSKEYDKPLHVALPWKMRISTPAVETTLLFLLCPPPPPPHTQTYKHILKNAAVYSCTLINYSTSRDTQKLDPNKIEIPGLLYFFFLFFSLFLFYLKIFFLYNQFVHPYYLDDSLFSILSFLVILFSLLSA